MNDIPESHARRALPTGDVSVRDRPPSRRSVRKKERRREIYDIIFNWFLLGMCIISIIAHIMWIKLLVISYVG